MPLTRRDIPNALTLLRLALAAACFAALALAEPHRPGSNAPIIAAAALFITAAITDALDGYLARRWNAITPFGRVMDPFADKVLVLGAFIMLAGPNFSLPAQLPTLSPDQLPPHPTTPSALPDAHAAQRLLISGVHAWMPVAILARELLVTSIRGVYESRGVDFSASLTGKLKMIAQSIACPAILAIIALSPSIGLRHAAIANAAIAWTTVLITAASAIPYLTKAFRHRATIHQP